MIAALFESVPRTAAAQYRLPLRELGRKLLAMIERQRNEENDEVITWQKVRTGILKARIAYHRSQAESYNTAPVIRSFKRDGYAIWMRNMAMRHAMKAHDLERRLRHPGSLGRLAPSR